MIRFLTTTLILFSATNQLIANETRLATFGQIEHLWDPANIYFNPALMQTYSNFATLEVGEFTDSIPANQYATLVFDINNINLGLTLNRVDPLSHYMFQESLNNAAYAPEKPVSLAISSTWDAVSLGLSLYYASAYQRGNSEVSDVKESIYAYSHEAGGQVGSVIELSSVLLEFWSGVNIFEYSSVINSSQEISNNEIESHFDQYFNTPFSINGGFRTTHQLGSKIRLYYAGHYQFANWGLNGIRRTNNELANENSSISSRDNYSVHEGSISTILEKSYGTKGGKWMGALVFNGVYTVSDPNPPADETRTGEYPYSESALYLPKITVGIEHPLFSWLILRSSANYQKPFENTQANYNEYENTMTRSLNTPAESDVFLTLGSSIQFKGVTIDVLMGEELFLSGPQFITNSESFPLFAQISLAYHFGEKSK